MMEFVENSDKALAALEKRDAAKEQSNEVKVTIMKNMTNSTCWHIFGLIHRKAK